MIVTNLVGQIQEARANNRISLPTIYIGLGLFVVAQHGYLLWGTSSTVMLGYMLLVAGMGYALYYFRHSLPKPNTFVFYPLAFIVVLAAARMFYGSESVSTSSMYFLLLLFMFGLYYVATIKGPDLLKFAGPAVLLFGTTTIVDGLWGVGTEDNFRASGICGNCNTVAALLCVLVFMLRGKWKYLTPAALLAIVFTGSYWALVATTLACAFGLVTKRIDWKSRMSLVVVALLVVTVVAGFGVGKFSKVWQTDRVIGGDAGPRLGVFKEALLDASILGHGFQPNSHQELDDDLSLVPNEESRYGQPVHNVPLMIMDDLGILALVAFLVAMGYALYKTRRYKLALLALIVVSFTGQFDYWWFNALMPVYFVVMGVVSWEILQEGKDVRVAKD